MWPERMEKLSKDLITQGKIEGESIGIKKGESIGIKKGKIEVVLNMHSANFDIETIARITGLSVGQVKDILESNISVN